MRITIFAGVSLGLIALLFVINCGDNKTVAPSVVKTDAYIGKIDSIPVAQLVGVKGNHIFLLSFSSDGSFTIDDTLFVPSMQLKVVTPVEIGTFTKSATAYTLSPASCADTGGHMAAANCSAATYTAAISGNTITLVAFFAGILDLVMTKQ